MTDEIEKLTKERDALRAKLAEVEADLEAEEKAALPSDIAMRAARGVDCCLERIEQPVVTLYVNLNREDGSTCVGVPREVSERDAEVRDLRAKLSEADATIERLTIERIGAAMRANEAEKDRDAAIARAEAAEAKVAGDWAYRAIQDGIAGLPPEVGCNGGSRSVACLRDAYERQKARAEAAERERDAAFDRGRAVGREDVGKYARAIGDIDAIVGITGVLPLRETVQAVRDLQARASAAEAALPPKRVRELIADAHRDDGGDSGHPGEVMAWLSRLPAPAAKEKSDDNRCKLCGWPRSGYGCEPGDCSYRPGRKHQLAAEAKIAAEAKAAQETPADGDATPEEGHGLDAGAVPTAASPAIVSEQASPEVLNRVPPSGGDIGGPSGSEKPGHVHATTPPGPRHAKPETTRDERDRRLGELARACAGDLLGLLHVVADALEGSPYQLPGHPNINRDRAEAVRAFAAALRAEREEAAK